MFDKIIKRTRFDNHILKCYRKVSSAGGGLVVVIYLKDGKFEVVKRKYQMKHIEKWRRAWKLRLIEEKNPHWKDLYYEIIK